MNIIICKKIYSSYQVDMRITKTMLIYINIYIV